MQQTTATKLVNLENKCEEKINKIFQLKNHHCHFSMETSDASDLGQVGEITGEQANRRLTDFYQGHSYMALLKWLYRKSDRKSFSKLCEHCIVVGKSKITQTSEKIGRTEITNCVKEKWRFQFPVEHGNCVYSWRQKSTAILREQSGVVIDTD